VLVQTQRADVLLIGVGAMAAVAVDAATELALQGVQATVVDPRWALPVEPALVAAAARYPLVVTVEDNGLSGGFGDAFSRAVRQAQLPVIVQTLGLAQQFLPHGQRSVLLAAQDLDAAGVAASVLAAHPAEG